MRGIVVAYSFVRFQDCQSVFMLTGVGRHLTAPDFCSTTRQSPAQGLFLIHPLVSSVVKSGPRQGKSTILKRFA